MNTILLQPTDVLFFRDGRPMEGSLAGHGAAWPLPNVTDAAFHAALHRSGLNGHAHDQRRHAERNGKDNRQFGSLVTAGPFPVRVADEKGQPFPQPQWFFPRPADAQLKGRVTVTLRPVRSLTQAHDDPWLASSLPDPLEYAVANTQPPSKDTGGEPWLSAPAYEAYLQDQSAPSDPSAHFLTDSAFSGTEHAVGIGIDPATGTTGQGEASGKIYSARYLRLRDNWRLGVFAKTAEKNGDPERHDLIPDLLTEQGQLLVGGQRRLCTATLEKAAPLPLPRGQTCGFAQHNGKYLVKWILLSPAIWPEIPAQSQDGRAMTPHPGGWLPNWVRQEDGQVMLRTGQRQRRNYDGKHRRGFADGSQEIAACLVAAIVPKPIPVTGWALAIQEKSSGMSNLQSEIRAAGAKSTHLAVPAGAVYYFEADTSEAAVALAAALNWHGAVVNASDRSDRSDPSNPTAIKNRRSTLLGEKGFGLGICGTWQFYEQSVRSV
jgi:CRISPR-associated protein Cmr3